MKTLCIVHLCSLDSVAYEGDAADARRLCDNLITAVQSAPPDRPIVVLDQGWGPPQFRCHRLVRASLLMRPTTIWFSHDESVNGWDAPMRRLADVLREHGITDVVLAGAWLGDGPPDSPRTSGCVTAVYRALIQQGITATIDGALCAHESWLTEEEA